MKHKIDKLLYESNSNGRLVEDNSGNMVTGRPTLVSLTRKVFNKIYDELAGVQPTKSQIATVFGVRYQYVNKDQTQRSDINLDNRNYGGEFNMDSVLDAPGVNMAQKDYFTKEGYVFQVITAGDYSTYTFDELYGKVFTGDLVLVTDAIIPHTKEEDEIQKTEFTINQWTAMVRTRKLKTDMSIELLTDMAAQGLDGDSAVEDLLSVAIAEEINTDIISKLVTVSIKEKRATPYMFDTTEYFAGRDLVARACRMAAQVTLDTSFKPTYLLASTHVAALISSSGLVDEDHRIVGTKMRLVVDTKTPVHYMLVGVKKQFDGLDTVSSVYYSPYIEEDEAGTFMVAGDYESLQPVIGIINRYALSTSPSFPDIVKPAKNYDGEDWVAAANKCQLSRMCLVDLKDNS